MNAKGGGAPRVECCAPLLHARDPAPSPPRACVGALERAASGTMAYMLDLWVALHTCMRVGP